MENLIMWRNRSLIAVFCLVMVVMPNLALAQAVTAPAAGASAVAPAASAGAVVTPTDPTLSPRDCTGWGITTLLSPFCLGRTLGALLSTLLVHMGVAVLDLSGLLFNKLVGLTILKFGAKDGIYGLAQDGIESTWTAFRDIANILIIGFFIFIAICTILGIKEYGYKKLIARVLIISVLLNFSLLFTKMIIDGSNFTAVQFYQGVIASSKTPSTPASGGTATDGSVANDANISGTFLQFMGITGVFDTYAQLRETQEKSDNGFVGIMFGILSFILLIAAAIVLAYGSFLLVTRTILLLFLLITSAIAFATYLLPAFADSKFGWGQWWSSLIRCAVFAPLLMILLWATALVSAQISAGGPAGSGTIGKFIAGGATAAAGVQAIFTYLIVLGMLYASFKIADSFSTTIGGFNLAGLAVSVPALLSGRAVGVMGRQILGRGAAGDSQRLHGKIEHEARVQALLPKSQQDSRKLEALLRKKATADIRAKRTYDPINTKVAQNLGKALGAPAGLMKENKTNFADSQKDAAKHAAAEAIEAAVSKDTAKKAAEEEIKNERASTREVVSQNHNKSKEELDVASRSEGLLKELVKKQDRANVVIAEATKAKISVQNNPTITTAKKSEIISQEDAKIATARQAVAGLPEQINAISQPIKDAQKRFSEAKKQLDEFEKETKTQIDARTTDIQNNSKQVAGDVGAGLTSSSFMNAVRQATPKRFADALRPNTTVAQEARSMVNKKIKAAPIKERAAAEREILDSAGESTGGGGAAAPEAH